MQYFRRSHIYVKDIGCRIVIFFSAAFARRRFGYIGPESLLVCAAGPAALNIRWRITKKGLMMISKMNWPMFDVIEFSRYWILVTGSWSLVAGCLSEVRSYQ